MESEILDGNFANQNTGLSDAAKSYLAETARWAKFIAIVGFVFLGLMVIVAFSIGSIFSTMADMPGADPALAMMPSAMFTVMYLIFAAIGFFPILYLYRFATKTQRALKSNNEALLTEGFSNLKSHYKFYGILMAIFIGIYGLIFVFAGLGALMM